MGSKKNSLWEDIVNSIIDHAIWFVGIIGIVSWLAWAIFGK